MVITVAGEPMLRGIVEVSSGGVPDPNYLYAVMPDRKTRVLLGRSVKALEITTETAVPTLSVEAIAMLHAEIAELRAQVASLRSRLEAK